MSISSLDDRYISKLKDIENIFTEENLIRYYIEIELIYLRNLLGIDLNINIPLDFYKRFKDIELRTKHDIKAVEYYIREITPTSVHHLIHWGLTSEDIKNIGFSLVLLEFNKHLQNKLILLLDTLENKFLANYYKRYIPAYTHGVAATPVKVITYKDYYIQNLKSLISTNICLNVKMAGSTGGLECSRINPNIDIIIDNTITEIKSKYNVNVASTLISKQTISGLSYSNFIHCLTDLSNLLQELSLDIWLYNSLGVLKIVKDKGQVGSSVMPSKSNPISFENSEGCFKIATNSLHHALNNLVQTRLQRDMSNSIIRRHISEPLGYLYLGVSQLIEHIPKIQYFEPQIASIFKSKGSIYLEFLQTLLRYKKVDNSYEIVDNNFTGDESVLDVLKSLNKILEDSQLNSIDSNWVKSNFVKYVEDILNTKVDYE